MTDVSVSVDVIDAPDIVVDPAVPLELSVVTPTDVEITVEQSSQYTLDFTAPSNDVTVTVNDAALNVLSVQPPPVVSFTVSGGGGGGGGGVDEVWIGEIAPADENIELWYDTNAVGPETPTGALAYVYDQVLPASVWTINHTLTFQPNVSIVDTAQDQVEGEIVYTTPSQITITFSAPFAGSAYLS